MHRAEGNIDRLVLRQQGFRVIDRDQCRAGHHDPMLGPVHMGLQRQFCARLDHDPLDLKSRPEAQGFIPAPGPVKAGEFRGLGVLGRGQHVDRLAHPLTGGHIRHQHRIPGRHGDRILQPETHQMQIGVIRAQEHILAIQRRDRAAGGHPGRIRAHGAPERVPGAEIGPATGHRHHRDIVGRLHHRIIQRHIPGLAIARRPEAEKAQIRRALRQGGLAGGDQIRGMGRECIQDIPDPEQEDAAIPEIAAIGQHLCRPRGVGFLHETADRLGLIRGRRGGQFQIAIAGLRSVGGNAEGHDLPPGRRRRPGPERGQKCRLIGDHMIGGGNQHQRLGLVGPGQGGDEHRRRGVAAFGFDHHRRIHQPHRRRLFRGDEAEGIMGHHQGGIEIRPGQAPERGLEQAFGAEEIGELLRIGFAADRPEPGARAATEYDRMNDLVGGWGLGHGGAALDTDDGTG